MIIEKSPYWDKLVDHYYDHVKWEGGPNNIYDWLEQEYSIKSDTGSQVLEFLDNKKGTWFVLKWS
jgi:hypothetical protein